MWWTTCHAMTFYIISKNHKHIQANKWQKLVQNSFIHKFYILTHLPWYMIKHITLKGWNGLKPKKCLACTRTCKYTQLIYKYTQMIYSTFYLGVKMYMVCIIVQLDAVKSVKFESSNCIQWSCNSQHNLLIIDWLHGIQRTKTWSTRSWITWASFNSCIMSLFWWLVSHTHMKSASLQPLKNKLRIFCTRPSADLWKGTVQFSMSQKTPIGTGAEQDADGTLDRITDIGTVNNTTM